MMQDYKVGATTTAAGMLAAAWPDSGSLVLYNVTADGRLLRLRRDPSSLTGWTEDQLALPAGATQASAVWTYVSSDGNSQLVVGVGVPFSDMLEDMDNPAGLYASGLDQEGAPTGFIAVGYSPLNQIGSARANGDDFFAYWCAGRPGIVFPGTGNLGGFIGGVPFGDPPMVMNPMLALPSGPTKLAALPLLPTGPAPLPSVIVGPGALICYSGTSIQPPNGWLGLSWTARSLPAPFSAADFVVLASPDGASVQVIAVDGTNQIHSLLGAEQPDGTIAWSANWSTVIPPGAPDLGYQEVKAWWDGNGDIQILVKDGAGLLRAVSQTGGLQWINIPVTDRPVSQWLLVEEEGQRGFVFVDADGRLDLRILDAGGEYRRELIQIDGDADVEETTTYRAGITITGSDKVGISGQPVSVAASDETEVSINGRPLIVGPNNPAAVTTDGTGSVWVTTTLGDSLYAPVFTFTSPLLEGGQLEVRPDADTQAYLSGITPAELLGQPVLNSAHNNEADATAVANALKQVVGMATAAYLPIHDGPSGKVRLANDHGVRWRALQPTAAPDLIGPGAVTQAAKHGWRYTMRSGRPVFEMLPAGDAAAFLAERRAVGSAHVREQLGWNPFSSDDWEDAFDSVADGISSVAEIISDGVNAAVTFIVDGIEFVVDAVIDTVAKVFDLVNGIFDAIGTVLGTVVGWLLDVIGFLFGWEDIKKQRDAFKAWARSFILAIPQTLTDPSIGAGQLRAFLDGAKTNVADWVAQARKQPISGQSFSGLTTGAPTLAGFFQAGGFSALPEATWITDKIQDAMEAFSQPLPTPTTPGLSEAMAAFEASLSNVAGALEAMVETIAPAIEAWITNPDSFADGNIDPLLDFIGSNAATAIDALQDLVDTGTALLQLFWNDPQAIVDWLDTSLQVPFFSAFYKAVMKSPFSILDLVCLAAGISAVATDNEISPPTPGVAADAEQDGWERAMLNLMIIGCLTTGFAAAASAASGEPAPTPVRILVFADSAVAMIVAFGIAGRSSWDGVATAQATIAGLTTVFTCFSSNSKKLLIPAAVQWALNLVWLIRSKSGGDIDENLLGYSVFEAVQVISYACAAFDRKMPPQAAMFFGGFQAGMSGMMTYFWKQSLSGPASAAGAVSVPAGLAAKGIFSIKAASA